MIRHAHLDNMSANLLGLPFQLITVGILAISLSGCFSSSSSSGGSDSTSDPDGGDSSGTALYSLTVDAAGIGPGTLVVSANGETLEIHEDGAFAFETEIEEGEDYAVSIDNEPEAPAQKCSATDAEGVVTDDIRVEVSCVTPLQLSGYVAKGDPGADTAVDLNVGEQSFAGPTDESGFFEFSIDVEDPGAVIELYFDNGEGRIFKTYPGSISTLSSNDGFVMDAEVSVLTSEASDFVNLNNMTNAVSGYVESQSEEQSGSISNLDEFLSESTLEVVLEVAAGTRHILEKEGGFPTFAGDTWEMARAVDDTREWVRSELGIARASAEFHEIAANVLDEAAEHRHPALDKVFLTPEVGDLPLEDGPVFMVQGHRWGYEAYAARFDLEGDQVQLSDHEATYSTGTVRQDDGLSFDFPGVSEAPRTAWRAGHEFDWKDSEGRWNHEFVEEYLDRLEIDRIVGRIGRGHLAWVTEFTTEKRVNRDPESDLEEGEEIPGESSRLVLLVKPGQNIALNAEDVPGSVVFPFPPHQWMDMVEPRKFPEDYESIVLGAAYDVGYGAAKDLVDFSVNGSGSLRVHEESIAWALGDRGELQVEMLGGGETYNIWYVAGSIFDKGYVIAERSDGSGGTVVSGMTMADEGGQYFDYSSMAGRWSQWHGTERQDFGDVQFEMRVDGFSDEALIGYYLEDGLPYPLDDPMHVENRPHFIEFDATDPSNPRMLFRTCRYWDGEDSWVAYDTFPAAPDPDECHETQERKMYVVRKEVERLYVLQHLDVREFNREGWDEWRVKNRHEGLRFWELVE